MGRPARWPGGETGSELHERLNPVRPTIRLGTLAGIPIGLHWSVVIIVGLVTIGLAGSLLPAAAAGYAEPLYTLTGLAVAVGLLASIVAHELGHALVARNNGIGTRAINLFALGGVAELDSEAQSPGAGARIALAGPAVSLVVGVGSLIAASAASFIGLPALVSAGLSVLGLINLVMAVFNMLPALPLDGGRVLQAALWRRSGDRERATISAAEVGRVLGWGLVAFGLWQFLAGAGGLWTMVIGWFVVSSAKAEAIRARFLIKARSWPAPLWYQWRSDIGQPTTARPTADTAPGWITSHRPTPNSRPNQPPMGQVIDVDGRPASGPVAAEGRQPIG